jgi:hypothetical protein
MTTKPSLARSLGNPDTPIKIYVYISRNDPKTFSFNVVIKFKPVFLDS